MPPRLFIASRFYHAPTWRAWRDAGVPICADWIDKIDLEKPPAEDWQQSLAQEWADKAQEIAQSDGIILYCQPGEVLRGALVEIGMAMAFQKRIACVGRCDATIGGPTQSTYVYNPLWTSFETLSDAFHGYGVRLPENLQFPEQVHMTA